MSTLLAGFLGSLVAGLSTGLGALPILFKANWNQASQRLMLAAAGGMMLGATFFSLLQPALAHVRQQGGTPLRAALTVSAGLLLGAVGLWGLHAAIPHDHFSKGREGSKAWSLGRNGMLVLAIALHNLPEGLSVGVAYGDTTLSTGYAVTLGIAAQNVPEGLAVAAALIADGSSRSRAFLISLLTGLVEPLGGLIGAAVVSLSLLVLPYALAFAAGAMLFVVSGEVLPETHVEGAERAATFAVIAGFVVMLATSVLLA